MNLIGKAEAYEWPDRIYGGVSKFFLDEKVIVNIPKLIDDKRRTEYKYTYTSKSQRLSDVCHHIVSEQVDELRGSSTK